MDSTTAICGDPANAARLRAALAAVARDPAAREIVRRWRSLTGGAATLLACSGGADSVALTLALTAAGTADGFVVGHVLHDLRPAAEAGGDRDFARSLAADLGVRFDERAVQVPRSENAEGAARRLRYAALTDMARAHGCGFVATAHHAEDQLETMLLALLRGSGARGLSGMRAKRRLGEGITLVRPMLGVSRDDAERICAIAGVAWRVDATNSDVSRARAAVRHRVLPTLEDIRPGAALRAVRTAEALQDTVFHVEQRTQAVFGEANAWPRETLRAESAVVVGEGLRRAFARATGGAKKDRLPRRVVEQAVGHIRSKSGETKVFQWPGGVRIEVTRDAVRLTSPC